MTGSDWVVALRRSRIIPLFFALAVASIAVVLSPSEVRYVTIAAMVGGVSLVVVAASRRAEPPSSLPLPLPLPTPKIRTTEFVPPAALPPPGILIGRAKELNRLKAHLVGSQRSTVVIVSGPPGIGKTALAIEVARSVSGSFRGGTLFAELPRDGTDDDILTSFVTALQPAGSAVPTDPEELRQQYRSITRTRSVLVVLDNVADADAVRALLPTGPECATIVTSRRSLPELGEWPEEKLARLAPTDSMSVLERIVGADRIQASQDAARAIARVVAGHPLALQLTAATLAHRPNFPLKAAADRVGAATATDDDFARALDLSYALLPDSEHTAVRVLGLLRTQTFAPWMLAALMDDPTENLTPYSDFEQSELDARDAVAWKICERLVHARLLTRVSDDSSGVASFAVLDHVWEIAQGHPAVEAEEAAQRRERLAEATNVRGQRSPRDILHDTVYDALDQGDLNRALSYARAALARARELDASDPSVADQHGLALAAVAEVLVEVGGFDDVNNLVGLVLRTASKPARPRALRSLGKLQRRQRRLDKALDTLHAALVAARAVHDGPEEMRVLRELAVIYATLNQTDDGLAVIERALAFDPRDDRARAALQPSLYWAKAIVLAGSKGPTAWVDAEECLHRGETLAAKAEPPQLLWAAWILFERARLAVRSGKLPLAQVLALDAASRFAALSHRYATARCRLLIGQSYLSEGKPTLALPFLEESVQTFASCGDRWSEGIAAEAFARALGPVERRVEAGRNLQRAIAIFAALGDASNTESAAQTLRELDLPHVLDWLNADDLTVPAQVLLPTGDQARH